jgi:TRAP-type mannitol/chloroaromatic compound transport system permease small subunit
LAVIDKVLDRIAQALLMCAALLGFCLAFVVCTDVGGRYFFSTPLKGTPELVSMAIVIIAYLQAGYAIRSGGMIAVDAFYVHYPMRMKALVSLIGSLLGVFLFALIFLGSYERAIDAWVTGEFEGEGALRVPAWPAKFVLVIGTLLASLSYLTLAIKQFRALLQGTEPPISSVAH